MIYIKKEKISVHFDDNVVRWLKVHRPHLPPDRSGHTGEPASFSLSLSPAAQVHHSDAVL